MGDPLSISAGVAGLLSLGLSVSSGLIQYYGAYKDSESSIASLCDSAEALSKTFRLLNDRILANSGGPRPLFSSETVDRVTESIIACASGVQKLKDKLDKAKGTKPGVSSRLRKLQYPFKEKTLEKLQGTVANLTDGLGLALDALQIETASNTLQKVDLIDGKVDSMIARSMNEEDEKILKSLSPLEPHSKQLDVLSRRHEGTGGWLLRSPEFRRWEDGTNKVLWCPGIPGAGKTVLTAVVIDHLQRAKRHEKVGIAHIYCVYDNPHQDLASFMGSLLQQLAEQFPALFQSINEAYQKGSRSGIGLPISGILQLLQSHVKNFDVVYIVIDALDEYPERNQTRTDLVRSLRSLGTNVLLMVTSRDIPAIEREFQKDVRMDIRAHDEDVKFFIEAHIARDDQMHELLEDEGSLRHDIVHCVREKANGM
jgi:hypothetical protein